MGKEYRDRDDVYEEEGDGESLEVSDDDKDEAEVEEVPTEVSLSAASSLLIILSGARSFFPPPRSSCSIFKDDIARCVVK
jgi:hypothetical protein